MFNIGEATTIKEIVIWVSIVGFCGPVVVLYMLVMNQYRAPTKKEVITYFLVFLIGSIVTGIYVYFKRVF